LLAGFVLAAAPAAPVALRGRLTIVGRRPHFRLGLDRFSCHACTSWYVSISCIRRFHSAASRAAKMGLPSGPLLHSRFTRFPHPGRLQTRQRRCAAAVKGPVLSFSGIAGGARKPAPQAVLPFRHFRDSLTNASFSRLRFPIPQPVRFWTSPIKDCVPGPCGRRSNEYGSRRPRPRASGNWENYVYAATPVPQELAQTFSLSGIGVPGLYVPQVMPFLCELLPSAALIRN